MSSHLSVSPSNIGAAIRGLNAAAHSAAEADDKAFAAMLDNASGPAPAPEPARRDNVVELSNDGDFAADDEPVDPEIIAAPVEQPAPIQDDAARAQQALGDLVDGLATLRATLEAGGTPEPADLEQLNAALDALAEALGIKLDALPSLDQLTALATQPLPEGATLQDQLAKGLAPLAQTLLGDSPTAGAELSAQLKDLGAKLAALLQSLNTGEIDPDQLAALGLDASPDAADPDLVANLEKLLKAAPVAADAPDFATAELKLSEPVLTGKPAAQPTGDSIATQTAEAVSGVATDADANPDSDAGTTPDDAPDTKTRDARPAAGPTATVVETAPDAQSTGQVGAQAKIETSVVARPVVAGYQTSQQQLNLPQLAFELVRQANEGNTRFQIRLDPPELGRIDVRLDIDANGQVNARLTVEKAETLDLMQRDQKGLERALQQAGLDGAKTNLEFSLKQNSSGQGQPGQDGQGGGGLFGDADTAAVEDVPVPTVNLYRGSLSASGVNIIA